MRHPIPAFERRRPRTFVATLLSYLLLAGHFAPLASGSARRPAPSSPAQAETQIPARQAAPVPAPLAAPLAAASLAVTKTDSFSDPDLDGKADPGQTITYTVTVQNTGNMDATNVTVTDTVDPNTTIVPGSVVATPLGNNDTYNVIGNVRIQPNAAQGVLANDRDTNSGNTGSGAGLTATGPNTGPSNGQLTLNSDGSFSYNPNPGFNGTDSFTYTVTDSGGRTATATVTLNVGDGNGGTTGVIWFVQAGAAAGGDGRLTNPFNCLVGAGCFDTVAADEAGDSIFLYTGTYTDNAPLTLLNNQKMVGQAASGTLASIAGVTVQPYSDALPTTGGTSPVVQTTGVVTTIITLGQNNTLRGFTTGDTTGTDILGNTFGTLVLGNSATPDMVIQGTGRVLHLSGGTLSTAGGLVSATSTGDTGQGLFISQVADSDGAGGGAFSFGSTTISGSATQGMLVQQSTADLNFGNTSVTGGTDGISLQNNSAGTRTFGTLTRSGGTGAGFLHANGGGAVTVSGATTITNPGGIGIQISASTTGVSFAATTVNKGSSAGVGVDISGSSGNTTFNSLAVTTMNGAGLVGTNNTGQINVTSAAGSGIAATGGPALNISKASAPATPVSLSFTTLASTNSGTTGINLDRISGSVSASNGMTTATNIQNPTGIGINVSNSTANVSFSHTVSNSSGGTGVTLTSNTGTISFGDLDVTPDANQRALHANSNTGTITTTAGDIAATGSVTLEITGSAGLLTPLAMVLNNVDSTNSTAGGVVINFVSGNLTVNDGGVATNISNSTGTGISVQNTAAGGTMNFGNTTVSGSGNANSDATGTGVFLNLNAGAVSFGALNISPDTGERGLHSTGSTGSITTASGTVTTTNAAAFEVSGVSNASRTPLNVQLTTVNVTGGGNSINGIALTNTSAINAPGGFRILGTAAGTDRCGGFINVPGNVITAPVAAECTGGRITGTGGAGDVTPADNAGVGIRLVNVDTVSLARVRVDSHSNHALYGSNVNGFALSNSLFDGTNGDDAASDENTVTFDNLLGSASISACSISGGHEDNLDVENDTGTLNRLTVSNSDFGTTSTSFGEDAFVFASRNNPTMRLTVNSSRFRHGRSDLFQAVARDTSTVEVVVLNSTFDNDHSNTLSGGGGVVIEADAAGDTPTLTFNVSNNTFRDALGHAVNVYKGPGSGSISGTINANVIGVSGVANSGSAQAGGIMVDGDGLGTITVNITNNQVRNYNEDAIHVNAGSSEAGGIQGDVTVNATVTGNTAEQPGAFGSNAFELNGGTNTGNTNQICLDVQNNTFENGGSVPNFEDDINLRQRFASVVRMPGYTGGAMDTGAVVTYMQNRNPGAETVVASASGTAGSGYFNTSPAGSACPQGAAPTGSAPSSDITATGGDDDSTQQGAPAAQPVSNNVTDRPFVGMPSSGGGTGATEQPDGSLGVHYGNGGSGSVPPSAEPPTDGGTEAGDDLPAPQPPSIVGDTITFNLGTIPAGKSVTVTFQVTVDDPFNGGSPQVSNQATVTADGGINVLSDDPSEPGANDPTVTPINVPQTVFSIRDAKAGEPASGTTPMVFNIVLPVPASSTVTVDYATADDVGGTNPATGGTCAGGADYETSSGTVTFMAGQMMRTISVDVCSDGNNAETNETFLVNLSNPSSGTILDAQAVGTITPTSEPGLLLITEVRTSGPGGTADDFVEIYNNTGAPHTVTASDASAGYGVFKMGSGCDATPILVGTIPNGTVIPRKGHYLLAGSAYSLTGANFPDESLSADIEDDSNIAVFTTADVTQLSTAARFDGVGFGTNTGSVCDLLREGTTMPKALGSTSEYSFLRKQDGATGNPLDTNVSSGDFIVISTTPATPVGDNATPRLGAPGPEGLAAPVVKTLGAGGDFNTFLLAPCAAPTASPNRVRDTTPGPAATSSLGTISFRRTYLNQTGGNVTRLRFRIVDMTTFPSPSGTADFRAITSSQVMVANPCTGTNVTVEGTTLETPPAQPNGGGINSTLAAGTVTLGTPLAHNQSINLQFLMGVQQTGTFRFLVVIEALP
jgi:uncharacterized repeat protein (TIGR01451 family)